MAREETTTAAPADVARLRLAVVRLARQIRQNAQSGVTPSQLSALATLHRHGPLSLARLAEQEVISRSTVTRLARNLELAGLAARLPDPEDGRSSILYLSEAGERLLRESRRRAESFLGARLATLDPDDRALLERVSELLERLAAGP